ncbi:vacuolar protein sorting/targeting protein 10 [Mycena rosella]|uniref:Vacuolar protein sorting/targeting protein 10 n=1 Tax=Mycena rosella TaxID=1033263 RepID=A0AAD7DM70_MYCRO|nr:vacuolar protein sorting/targeting protein 10 [Mycena rosella]
MHRHLFAAFLCLLSLPFLLVAQEPTHAISNFDNLPARLFFFDDTTFAIYHDSIKGNIYVSPDEGKTWNRAEGIPEGDAAMVIEHPFDNSYAFVLTSKNKHYRTEDRGKTWRSFEVPIQPALVARPLSFHSDPKKYGYILYQGTACDKNGWGAVCHDETYVTTNAFSSSPEKMLEDTSRCQFAHSSVDFKHAAHEDLIYCVAFDTKAIHGGHSLSSSRLFSSTDFFKTKNAEDLGIDKNAKGVVAFAIVSKYAVVALKDLSAASQGDMLLYVTVDTKTWAKARFPHASSAQLRENAYTLVESTTHSLAVDVVLQDQGTVGTLFVSNSNGTFFVQSLKDTNRNEMGFVDYERIYGIEGVGIANVVLNAAEVEGRGAPKQLKSLITFDDGSSWTPLRAPAEDSGGKRVGCNPDDIDECSLHLHSVTTPHNFGRIFSSPAPGFVMAVGSIGKSLLPYEESDTFLSSDGGVTWTMVRQDAHKYEFGDSGSILVVVNDEEGVSDLRYSLDLGKSWKIFDFGIKLRARALTTLPDSTSQKFILLGQVARKDQTKEIGRFVVVYLDFAPTRKRQCTKDDFERWYARSTTSQCLMGHKQWYTRRKQNVECYVGEKFTDPAVHEDDCDCTDADYECDYNYIRESDHCVAVGLEPIPAGICKSPTGTYQGSSGYRKIPGNTCIGGTKDKTIEKSCTQAQPEEGEIIHVPFSFPSRIIQHAYFKDSTTILVRLEDHSIWQSSNEGRTWEQKFETEHFLAFYHHKYTDARAYLITDTEKFYTTTDSGRSWNPMNAPTPPNSFRAQVLRFHPDSDKLIWTGNKDCDQPLSMNCHAEAQYSRDNGRQWTFVENYVVNCAWAKDAKLDADPTEILCESYRDKIGSQRFFQGDNPLSLVEGSSYFTQKKKLFNEVVGFAKFSEFLIVAQLLPEKRSLDLQVSLDGVKFATGMFPPTMHPETHAYTVLESSTGSLFLHMTMSEAPSPYWGNILKSNSNGTYFGLSIENVNRDERGFVDFEKMIGLDGIALINVVANTHEAVVTGRKTLQTRITHNDGGTWKPLKPPAVDSLGNKYECQNTGCALHIHGYTERTDPRATYSSPGIVGLLMAVGNVGEALAPYEQSDTFLSRDAGFTWEEVHKDAHMWEFGDSGAILVIVNDEEPTDQVLFSTDEGLNWHEYKFAEEKMRVQSIVTVPSDTSRRFILIGNVPHTAGSTVVHLDFSTLTSLQCVLNVENPGKDDFELWSPSEERQEQCLFGKQTLYHRRVRDKNCVVGNQPKAAERIEKHCMCNKADFECEFNYFKNDADECVLAPGTTPLADDSSCRNGDDYWYERTAYRKISYSECEGGDRPDQGTKHQCPGFAGHSGFFWFMVILFPIIFVGLVAYWYYNRSGLARGTIRLPGDGTPAFARHSGGAMDTIASIPWFLIGIAGIAWEWTTSRFQSSFPNRRGYRNLPVDEDAQILRFEDEE